MSTRDPLSKVLLYSHDSYGLGHLRRNLVIARQLLGGTARPQVVLASGSPVLQRVERPADLRCAQLPPIVKTGPDEYRPLEPRLSMSLVSRARSAVMCDIVERWRPDVLLVDHAPHGVKGELLPVFETIRRRSPATAVVLGLRDILDEPARVRAAWGAQGVYETLTSTYDQVLVYGEQDVFDLVSDYGLPEPLVSNVEFCGYVTGGTTARPAVPQGEPARSGRGYLFGTVGGGGDGVEVLIATARAAAAIGADAVLCTGPLMSGDDRHLLAETVGSLPGVRMVEHVPDITAMAGAARCVVSRGGYNTLCELVALEVPVVVVPRVWPRHEQLLRARAFAERGLVTVVHPHHEELDAQVAGAVATTADRPPSRRRPLDLDGGRRVVEVLRRAACGDARLARVPA